MLDWWKKPALGPEVDEDGQPRIWYPLLGHLLAVVGVIALGLYLGRRQGDTGLLGIALLILTTSGCIGGALGFLFAVPRLNPQAEAAAAAAAVVGRDAAADAGSGNGGGNGGANGPDRRLLTTNNNLEKVSDWLTTMLVGVGLTQLGNLNGALLGFRGFLREEVLLYPDAKLAPAGVLPAVGPMLLLAGAAAGFVYFYVFSRVVIAPKLNRTEQILATPPRVNSPKAAAEIRSVAQNLPIDTVLTRNVAAASAPSVQDSLSLMLQALYQEDGYLNAIRVGDALRGTGAEKLGDYWFYLAAARGQEYSAATAPAEQATARARMLAAASRAIEIDPRYRARLWDISKADGVDNDLAPFRDDPDFLTIVGRTGTSATPAATPVAPPPAPPAPPPAEPRADPQQATAEAQPEGATPPPDATGSPTPEAPSGT